MTPGLRLNTAHAHPWAAVVSGTAWKRHTLGSGGVLTAEYTRGPLILWATRPGEGVQADGAAVSALEDRIGRLNTSQVFGRFKWAVRGKVRHSVRWKTGRRPRRLRKLEALADLRYTALVADRRAAGRRGVIFALAPKTAKARRAETAYSEREAYFDRLCEIAPDVYVVEENLCMPCPSPKTLRLLEEYRRCIKTYGPVASYWRAKACKLEQELLGYLLLNKDSRALRVYLPYRLVSKNSTTTH